MSAPAIMGLGSMFRKFPTGGAPSKAGRCGSLLVWSKPNPIKRVRSTGNGRKILPNRGDVILRGR